jgi:hypothetical protein
MSEQVWVALIAAGAANVASIGAQIIGAFVSHSQEKRRLDLDERKLFADTRRVAFVAVVGQRTGPIAILLAQAASRVPELVPIRHGRMLVSPFTFYRGAAAVIAADLATTPNSGITVQACGDARQLRRLRRP